MFPMFTGVVSWLAMLQEDGYSKLRSSMLASRPHAEAAVEHALKQLRAYAAAVDTSLSSSSSLPRREWRCWRLLRLLCAQR